MTGSTDAIENSKPNLIVIPCLNEEKHIEKLVHEMVHQNPSSLIIIADGGSRDRTPEIAGRLAQQYPNVRFLKNPKRIQSAALNLAVATYGAGAEYLIRVDAHCNYPANYCRILIDEAERTRASSVVVAMKTEGKAFFQKIAAAAQNSKLGNGGSAHRNIGKDGKWVDHGHHAFMRIDAFQKLGGYDETFAHNEDAELDVRFGKAGFKIWLTGKTYVTYYPRSSFMGIFRQYLSYGYGRARNMLKHRNIPKLRQLMPVGVLPAAVLALFSGLFPLAALPLLLWTALCLGYGVFFGLKSKDTSLMLIGPVAMLMHFSWSFGFWCGTFGTFLGLA
jgi:succinoglycan biosynthesis protein ExoA